MTESGGIVNIEAGHSGDDPGCAHTRLTSTEGQDPNMDESAGAPHDRKIYSLESRGRQLWESNDVQGAETLFLQGAESGSLNSMKCLATLMNSRKDFSSAEVWFRRAAELGDAESMFHLGVLLRNANDDEGSQKWLTEAADLGNVRAMVALASLLKKLDRIPAAEEWYRKASEHGDSGAMEQLVWLLSGRGADEEAKKWALAGADTGSSYLKRFMGNRAFHLRDFDQAMRWYREAVDAGDSESLGYLGQLYQSRGEFSAAGGLLARAVDRNLEGAHDALAKLNGAESSAQVLAGVTFNTFEWAPNSFNKHSRSWRGEAATLTERFFDFEPDFDSFDVDEIREEMIELQGYLQSPSFDIASLDLEEYLGKINSASMPSQVTLIELDCFLHEGVKCVSSISRHRMKGHVHFLSSTLALFKSCFYLIGIEVEEGEEVGEREGAVAQLALTTSNGGELDEVSFDPYDRRWDGLIPIDKDPLARLRILATHLRRSIHFGEYTASMEPFDPETS